MRILHQQSGPDALDTLAARPGIIDPQDEGVTERCEPQAFSARRVPTDPYAAWLHQRELERLPDERASVRWVYRGPILRGHEAGARERLDEGAAPLIGV